MSTNSAEKTIQFTKRLRDEASHEPEKVHTGEVTKETQIQELEKLKQTESESPTKGIEK